MGKKDKKTEDRDGAKEIIKKGRNLISPEAVGRSFTELKTGPRLNLCADRSGVLSLHHSRMQCA